MKKDNLIFVLDKLLEMYPNAETELKYETPFQLLVAVILSAQSTDKQVNKVTSTFFDKIKKPQDILELGFEGLLDSIKSIGLYKGKAKNIYKLSQIMSSEEYSSSFQNLSLSAEDIYKNYGYIIPDTLLEFIKLPGVGEKTAKVVMHVLYGSKLIPVDTHIQRVSTRLGITSTKNPLQTSKELEKIIPDEYKSTSHHTILLFGRYHCKAIRPMCETCPFTSFCLYYKQVVVKNKSK